MRNCIHVSTTLEKGLLQRVNDFCAQEERSKSWLISKAVERLLDELETKTSFSTDELEKLEKIANQKGKSYSTPKQAKKHLLAL
ncbi:MAG: hypothetical protein WC614_02720 [bacterium]